MPDMERLFRSLEDHIASTPEEKAYVRGKHDGMDKARWEIAKLVAGFFAGLLLANLVWTLFS
jgi:hypothetical protein